MRLSRFLSVWVGLIHSVDVLNRTKRMLLLKRDFFLPNGLWTSTSAFSCLWAQADTLAIPGSRADQPSEPDCTIGSPGFQLASSPCTPWTCLPAQVREPIPYRKYLSVYIHKHVSVCTHTQPVPYRKYLSISYTPRHSPSHSLSHCFLGES